MNAFWNGSFGFSLLASVREDKTMDDKEGEVKDQVHTQSIAICKLELELFDTIRSKLLL